MSTARRSLVLLTAAALIGTLAHAQSTADDTAAHTQSTAVGTHTSRVSLALTYDTQGSNLTTTNRFWLQGGAAELTAAAFHGVGATATVLGLHSANSGDGVPLNLVIFAFGPSYTYTHHHGAHSLDIFAHGLAGEADGFHGTYPGSSGPLSSASSLAVLAGGGIDLGLSHHLAVRIVQADYLRTQLPNSLTNVQNSLRLGIGIVLR